MYTYINSKVNWFNKLDYVFHTNIIASCQQNRYVRLVISSNTNDVIRPVLNFLLFFLTKRFHKYKKAQNRLQRTKIINVCKKHLSSKINEVIKFFNQFHFDSLVFNQFRLDNLV